MSVRGKSNWGWTHPHPAPLLEGEGLKDKDNSIALPRDCEERCVARKQFHPCTPCSRGKRSQALGARLPRCSRIRRAQAGGRVVKGSLRLPPEGAPLIEDLSYEAACSGAERILVKGRGLKADVFITSIGDSRFVVKDFGRKGVIERNLIGRIVIGREARAYRALAGIDGLPSRFKRLTPFSIAIEYLEGRDLGAINRGEIGPGVLRQFEAVVEELHERGWVHLDLQRRSNILLVNGRVFVVDLASAVHPGSIPLVGRWLTWLFGLADRMSLIKMKSIYAPELLTPRERQWLKIRNLTMPRKW